MSDLLDPYATANHTGDEKPLRGTEFIYDDAEPNHPLPYLTQDFWSWAYSDLLRNTQRAVFAEYVVKMALELGGCRVNRGVRSAFEPYDLLGPNIGSKPSKLEVKSAATVQVWSPRGNRISFSIAPARIPEERGDYRDDAPIQRNSGIYVFCIYDPRSKNGTLYSDANVLNMKFWRFYICPTFQLSVLDAYALDEPCTIKEYRKTITEKVLNEKLHRTCLRFSDLYDGILSACIEIKSSGGENL